MLSLDGTVINNDMTEWCPWLGNWEPDSSEKCLVLDTNILIYKECSVWFKNYLLMFRWRSWLGNGGARFKWRMFSSRL